MILTASPALAVDFSKPVLDMTGKPYLAEDGKTPKTLGQFCEDALVADFPDERGKVEGAEKFKRWQLAVKIRDGAKDLTAEETATVKALVGKGYAPAVVGPIWQALDPAVK